MKYGKNVLTLCLICALLLAGCGQKPSDPQDIPNTPDVSGDAPTVPEAPEVPGTDTPPVPVQPSPSEEEQALLEAAILRSEMAGLVQSVLPEGSFTLAAEPLEESENRWDIWGFQVKNGIRQPWRNIAAITPDGKDYSLQLDEPGDSAPAWVAVQNYRLLESDLTCSTAQLLEHLGFDPSGDIVYTDFQAAMLRIVTPALYDSRFASLFSDKAGMLVYAEAGATGTLYLVDSVEQQADGSWLSHEHAYDLQGRREDYTARVTLETLPDGRLVVASWAAVSE